MNNLYKLMLGAMCVACCATAAQAQDESVEFTYTNNRTSGYVGFGKAGVVQGAMRITNPEWVGAKVTGMKVYGLKPVEGTITDYQLWYSNQLPGNSLPNSISVTPDASGNLIGTFDTPAVIGEDGLFLGYSFDVTQCTESSPNSVKNPIPYCKLSNLSNSMILRLAGDNWYDYSEDYGALTIVAYLSTDGLNENAVQIKDLISCPIAVPGKASTVKFAVTNTGTKAVNNIEYSYTLNGETVNAQKRVVLSGMGKSANVIVEYNALNEVGIYPTNFTITKVNDMVNSSPNHTVDFRLCIPSFTPQRKVLMEEGTGTWCGWCTRGWLAMRELNRQMPDVFVGAAYHSSDVMDIMPGAMPFDFGGGFPGCAIDRTINGIDPFYGTNTGKELGIKLNIESQAALNGCGNINLNTKWVDDEKSAVEVEAEVHLGAVAPQGEMKLAYLLIQNGINKPGVKNFNQGNYYNGQSYSGILKELCQMPREITDITFDDVVINADYSFGVEGSLPEFSEIKIGNTYKHSVTLNASNIYAPGYEGDEDNLLSVEPDDMEVIVMLLSGDKVYNCNKVKAGESVGINDINAEMNSQATSVYYDLMGRQVSQPQNGIFIKKQGNVTTKVVK